MKMAGDYRLLLTVVAFGVAQSAAAEQAAPMQFVTLGAGGGPIVQVKRSQPANAVVIGSAIYLFDVGEGTLRQLHAAGLPLSRIKGIFLSHHHFDHVAGLAPLLQDRWVIGYMAPLPVVGPPGTKQMLQDMATSFAAIEKSPLAIGEPTKPDIRTTIAPRDMKPSMEVPEVVFEDANIRVAAVVNAHYHNPDGTEFTGVARSYSFRIESGGRVIVFTGDTGPSTRLTDLAWGANLLVSEVINRTKIRAALHHIPGLPPQSLLPLLRHMELDHLSGEEVGRLAAAAKVERVVLTHLSPGLDDETDTVGDTRGIAVTFHGPVTVAADLDRY